MSTTPAGPTNAPVVVTVTGPERRHAIQTSPGRPAAPPCRLAAADDQEVLITIHTTLAGVAR